MKRACLLKDKYKHELIHSSFIRPKIVRMKHHAIIERVMKSLQIKNYRIIYLMFFLVFSIESISANSITDSLFIKGNNFYMQHNYAKAEECYNRVVSLGYESAELYYNLGNSHYKQNNFAQAILYYEKALLLKPTDQDIKQNLALANLHVIDQINSIPEFFLKKWINGVRGLFSPNQWAYVCIGLFAFSLALLIIYYLSNNKVIKKIGFSTWSVLIVLTIVSMILMFSRIHKLKAHDFAIIIAPVVNARSSPDTQSTNTFILHEGSKVVVTDSVQNWKEIRIANGNKGWVQEESLSKI